MQQLVWTRESQDLRARAWACAKLDLERDAEEGGLQGTTFSFLKGGRSSTWEARARTHWQGATSDFAQRRLPLYDIFISRYSQRRKFTQRLPVSSCALRQHREWSRSSTGEARVRIHWQGEFLPQLHSVMSNHHCQL